MNYPARLATMLAFTLMAAALTTSALAAPLTHDACGRPSTHPEFNKGDSSAATGVLCLFSAIGALGTMGQGRQPPYEGWVPPPPAIDATDPRAPAPAPAPPARKDPDTPTR